jgi:protein-tyrosine-phosphatase
MRVIARARSASAEQVLERELAEPNEAVALHPESVGVEALERGPIGKQV